jgi:hypothetical protein
MSNFGSIGKFFRRISSSISQPRDDAQNRQPKKNIELREQDFLTKSKDVKDSVQSTVFHKDAKTPGNRLNASLDPKVVPKHGSGPTLVQPDGDAKIQDAKGTALSEFDFMTSQEVIDDLDKREAISERDKKAAEYVPVSSERLFTRSMSDSERTAIVQAVAAMSSAESETVITQSLTLIEKTNGRFYEMDGYGRAIILEAVATTPAAEREALIIQSLRLISRDGDYNVRREIVRAIAAAPAAERETFVTQSLRIFRKKVDPWEGMDSWDDRVGMIRAMAAIPAAERETVVTQSLRLVLEDWPEILNWRDLDIIVRAVAAIPPAEREAIVTQSLRLVSLSESTWYRQNVRHIGNIGYMGDSRARLVQSIASLPGNEREAFVALLEPHRNRIRFNISHAARALADTPAEARVAHLQALIAPPEPVIGHPPGARGPAPVDREMVMREERVIAVAKSIDALRTNITSPIAVVNALDAIESHIKTLSDAKVKPEVLDTIRGGATELENALRTLQGKHRIGDFAVAIRNKPPFKLQDGKSITLDELCAYEWTAIERYQAPSGRLEDTERDQATMKQGIVMALAQCIEDDTHRVCGVGFSERLISVLAGHYPFVQVKFVTRAERETAVFREVFQELAAQEPQPSRQVLQEAFQRAEAIFRKCEDDGDLTHDDYKACHSSLVSYVGSTFQDFTPDPSPAAVSMPKKAEAQVSKPSIPKKSDTVKVVPPMDLKSLSHGPEFVAWYIQQTKDDKTLSPSHQQQLIDKLYALHAKNQLTDGDVAHLQAMINENTSLGAQIGLLRFVVGCAYQPSPSGGLAAVMDHVKHLLGQVMMIGMAEGARLSKIREAGQAFTAAVCARGDLGVQDVSTQEHRDLLKCLNDLHKILGLSPLEMRVVMDTSKDAILARELQERDR